MHRDPAALAATPLDLLVVGGGIYGVCAARAASRHGLKVALVERDDFGAATSANSLHTMHGGLRYLQRLDLRRMRESIRERRFWLQHAPALVKPLPFILPTFGHGLRGPEVLQTALLLNDLISADRNSGSARSARLARGRRLAPAEARERFDGLELGDYNGAALWYDGFNDSPERLLLALLKDAVQAGAKAANYCRVEQLLLQHGRVIGAEVRDQLTGRQHSLHADCVLNAAGPWVDAVASLARPRGETTAAPMFWPSKAMNLVVRRLPFEAAVGIPALKSSADRAAMLGKDAGTYFIMPWGDYSLIGTRHLRYQGSADELQVDGGEVAEFLAALNPILGPWQLGLEDVVAVKCGLLPETPGEDGVILQKHPLIVDHQRREGIAGLVSMVGVKWTTARLVAERAVGIVCRKLSRCSPPSGASGSDSVNEGWKVALPATCEGFPAQVRHAVREEMALFLADVLLRRSHPPAFLAADPALVGICADVMSEELGWSEMEHARQLRLYGETTARHQSWRPAQTHGLTTTPANLNLY
jgi:glycerol-3-phosphate dehydrogenase